MVSALGEYVFAGGVVGWPNNTKQRSETESTENEDVERLYVCSPVCCSLVGILYVLQCLIIVFVYYYFVCTIVISIVLAATKVYPCQKK